MTIQANFPNVQPSLLLDFANAQQLPPSVTFTRATTATYYNGSTSAKAEQNLQLYSQEFNSWVATSCSATANTTTAPDGTSTADTVTVTVANAEHYIARNETNCTAGVQTTVSVYAKNGTQNYIQFSVSGNGGLYANFDLSTGAVGTSALVTSTSITSVGSGWYRCVATFTPSVSGFMFIALVNSASAGRLGIYTPASATTVFLWGAQVEQRSTVSSYTVTSTATITNYNPVLLTAGGGQPRFQHDPTTSESLGLLIEESRTNRFTYSTTFNVLGWLPNNVTLNAGIPELNIYTVIPSTAGTTHQFYDQIGVAVSAVPYTISFNAKAYGYTKIKIADVSTGNGCWFDVSAGTVGTANSGYVGTISAIGNGFYRCSVTFTPSAGTVYYGLYIGDTTESTSFSGNGFSGVYISSPQFETGSFATSYIPTITAAATRAADVVSMTGANFSSWYSPGNGTFYAEASTASTASDVMIAEATNSSGAFLDFSMTFATTSTQFINRFVASNNDMRKSSAVTANTMVKFSGSITNSSGTTLASTAGATASATGSQSALFGADRMFIGSRGGSSLFLNAPIRKFAFYPAQLTQTQQNSITG